MTQPTNTSLQTQKFSAKVSLDNRDNTKKNRNCIRPVELCDIVRCHFVTTIVLFSHLSSQFCSIYLHFNHNQQTHTFCRYCFLKYCTRFWYLLLCNRDPFVNGNFRMLQSVIFCAFSSPIHTKCKKSIWTGSKLSL